MKVIGLTGGIACGKSTVSEIMRQKHGCVIVDADRIAHEALQPGNEPYEQVVKHFDEHKQELLASEGVESILRRDGSRQIDRDLLGRLVFSRPELRKKLNGWTHPWVFKQMLKQVWNEWSVWDWLPGGGGGGGSRDGKIVVLDVPLLFETRYFAHLCTKTVVISVEPESLQLERLLKRNPHLTEEQARQRMASQMPLAAKRQLADFVIDNSGSVEDTSRQVDDIIDKVKQVRWTMFGA